MSHKRALHISRRKVLCVPQKSLITSAKEPSISYKKSPHLLLKNPVYPANIPVSAKNSFASHAKALDLPQKTPIFSAKEPHILHKRAPYLLQKSPVPLKKSVCISRKKSPISSAQEPCISHQKAV